MKDHQPISKPISLSQTNELEVTDKKLGSLNSSQDLFQGSFRGRTVQKWQNLKNASTKSKVAMLAACAALLAAGVVYRYRGVCKGEIGNLTIGSFNYEGCLVDGKPEGYGKGVNQNGVCVGYWNLGRIYRTERDCIYIGSPFDYLKEVNNTQKSDYNGSNPTLLWKTEEKKKPGLTCPYEPDSGNCTSAHLSALLNQLNNDRIIKFTEFFMNNSNHDRR